MLQARAEKLSDQCYWKLSTEYSDRRRKNVFNTLYNKNFRWIEKLKRFANIVTIIASQKNKLKDIYIEFHIQIENIWKRKMILINEDTQINYINNILTKK